MNKPNKIRILLVVRWPVGGIRTFIRYVYRHYEPDKYEFTILGPDHPEIDILQEDLINHNITIKKVSKQPSSIELFKAIFFILTSTNYDIVHSHGFTSGMCAALPAYLTRSPHILTSHDVLSEKQFQGVAGRIKKLSMRIVFSFIDVIHSVSNDAQANLLEYFPGLSKTPQKCVVVRNGIEVERFIDVQPREIRAELGVGDDTYIIGFLGRFMAQKGFVYLVDAIETLSQRGYLPDKVLVVVLGEGGFIREEVTGLAKRGLLEYFKFLPFTPNIASTIKGLDFVVMPSLWEACPLLPMEVLVAGTPLIATNCIGLREIIQNTPTYIIPPKDSAALADGLELFIENSPKTIFDNYAPKAAEMFNVENQVIALKKIIEDCLQ